VDPSTLTSATPETLRSVHPTAPSPHKKARRRRLTIGERLARSTDVFFDTVGMRPLGIIVFAASAVALAELLGASVATVRVEAIATAQIIDHPSRVASFVTAVYVKPGDRVDVGAPLVELSPHFINQEIQQLDREIEQLINESHLVQAKLIVDEERWVRPGLRQMPKRPSLEVPTDAYFAKQRELIESNRRALLDNRAALTIYSDFEGIVADVTWRGASISPGGSVASVMPEYAEEIVAYVPPSTNPALIGDDAVGYIIGADFEACRAPGQIQRRGAAVEEAPGQLKQIFSEPLHGMPVHVSIPPGCKLGNGQVLRLDFRLETPA